MSVAPAKPPRLLGLAALLRAAFNDEDLTVHVPPLMERAQQNNDAYAMLDLALILELRFQKDISLQVQREALKLQQHFMIIQGAEGALRLLVIKAPGDLMSNTPIECILEGAGFNVDVLYVGPGLPWPLQLPPHDLVFVAISESDAHRSLLADLAVRLDRWPCPILNDPRRIPLLSRSEAFEVIRDIPGICMAETVRVHRAVLQQLCAAPDPLQELPPRVSFPIIVRPLGSHAGTDLCRLEAPAEIAAYLDRVAAQEFFLANFIDYASADGLFRKYRVVLIQGRAFVCHMGISEHWMVHYPYEEMKAHHGRRAEEEALMANFDHNFASRHGDALAGLERRFGLDYVGIDCAETSDGRLLIFEVANALVIHAMDDPEIFPYKQMQMQKTFLAFHDMLRRRAVACT